MDIDMVVIHQTGGGSFESNITWFNNPGARVSAHYLIGKDGKIAMLVPEDTVAWHAGESRWLGRSGVNRFSLGIELVGSPGSMYPESQLASLCGLLADIVARYPKVTIDRIVGHADVAPGRKVDPGSLFPWDKVRAGVSALLTLDR